MSKFNKFVMTSAKLEAALVNDAFITGLPKMAAIMTRLGDQVVIEKKGKKKMFAQLGQYLVKIPIEKVTEKGTEIDYDFFILPNDVFRTLFVEEPVEDAPPIPNPANRKRAVRSKANPEAKEVAEILEEEIEEEVAGE